MCQGGHFFEEAQHPQGLQIAERGSPVEAGVAGHRGVGHGAGGVQGAYGQAAAHRLRAGPPADTAGELAQVAAHGDVNIGAHPIVARACGRSGQRAGETAVERDVDVAQHVRRDRRHDEAPVGVPAVKQRGGGGVAEALAARQRPQPRAEDPSGERPLARMQVVAGRSGHDVAARRSQGGVPRPASGHPRCRVRAATRRSTKVTAPHGWPRRDRRGPARTPPPGPAAAPSVRDAAPSWSCPPRVGR